MLGDRTAWKRVRRLEVRGEIDSDHRFLTVKLESGIRREKREVREKEEKKWEMVEDWSD